MANKMEVCIHPLRNPFHGPNSIMSKRIPPARWTANKITKAHSPNLKIQKSVKASDFSKPCAPRKDWDSIKKCSGIKQANNKPEKR